MGKNFHQSTLGIYFTQYIEPLPFGTNAKEYAEEMVRREGGKPFIYKCKIHTKNPLILDSNDWGSSARFIDKNRNDIKRYMEHDNHDCIIAYDFEEEMRWREYILATKKLDLIEIVDMFEYKENPNTNYFTDVI